MGTCANPSSVVLSSGLLPLLKGHQHLQCLGDVYTPGLAAYVFFWGEPHVLSGFWGEKGGETKKKTKNDAILGNQNTPHPAPGACGSLSRFRRASGCKASPSWASPSTSTSPFAFSMRLGSKGRQWAHFYLLKVVFLLK